MLSIYDMLRDNQDIGLDSIALTYYAKKITFRELFDNIESTAKSLCAFGVGEGDNVGIHCEHIPETVYIYYACTTIGAGVVMLDVQYAIEVVQSILREHMPKVLYVKNDLLVPEYKTYLSGAFYIEHVVAI